MTRDTVDVIDALKANFFKRIVDLSPYAHGRMIEKICADILAAELFRNRDHVWQSPEIVAAYEFCAEKAMLDVFNEEWRRVERRQKFKVKLVEPPVVVRDIA